MKIPPICPRCGGWIPNNATPGAYPGAVSRTDNQTEVCSECGQKEAMEDFFDSEGCLSQQEWKAHG